MTNYEEYLESQEWEGLRGKARDRANGQCEFCGDLGSIAHHVKYPAIFKHDHVDNIVFVCRGCHELSHGIRRLSRHLPFKALVDEMLVELRRATYDPEVLAYDKRGYEREFSKEA